MSNKTLEVAVLLIGGLCFASCDVSNLAPQEPEPKRTESVLSADPVSFATSLGSSRTLGRSLDLEGGGCAQSPGYWCQDSGAVDTYAADAIVLLEGEGVFVLTDAGDVRDAVCDTSRQLLRHLVSLALNLAAGFVSDSDPLKGGGTIGEAFRMGAAIYLMGDAASFEERSAAKNLLEGINGNEVLTNSCTPPPPAEGGGPGTNNGNSGNSNGTPGGGQPSPSAPCTPLPNEKKIEICHIPPGNPMNSKTLSISPNAWPAHEAHGDTCGACP